MTGSPITVIMPVYNEEKVLEEQLQRLTWADQVIVADTDSSDRSREIAGRYADRVLHLQRMKACPAVFKVLDSGIVRNDWVLVWEADTAPELGLFDELQELAGRDDLAAVDIPRYNMYHGHAMFPTDQRLMFHLSKVDIEHTSHHLFDHIQANGRVATTKHGCVHVRDQSVTEMVNKLNEYTTREMRDRYVRGEGQCNHNMVVEPIKMFIYRYIRKGGWRHGIVGLFYSMHFAYYQLVLEMKHWERERQ